MVEESRELSGHESLSEGSIVSVIYIYESVFG